MGLQTGRLKIQKLLFLTVAIFFIFSCAGLSTQSDTADPFEQGLALFKQGKYEKALPFFERSVESRTDFAKGYLYLGRSFLNLSKWHKAIPPIRTAISLSTGKMKQEAANVLLDALMGAALLEFEKGDLDSAAGHLKEILDIKPEFIKARDELVKTLFAFADKLMSEGLIDEAILRYKEILALAPALLRAQEDLIRALSEFAERLLQEGRFEDAIEPYSELIELAPEEPGAYIGLAKALLKNGDIVKALQTIKNALQKDPASSEALSLFREILMQ
ncbi:MAG TPA: tetratricopeptide repeat protein [Nitrospirae bacterium]|nr:tetratricopeptide repeat protein [bacterium BMS3Bbin08]HDK41546.1 tetratricopeptide repeat protein [Nitrospirota bacterium]